MGKSLNNCIYLSDDKETLRKKIFSVYTDPNRIHKTDKGQVEGNIAFVYHDAFNDNIDEVRDLKERYQSGNVGDVEVKEKLFLAMNNKLSSIRDKRIEAKSKINSLYEMMLEHTKHTKNIAKETVDKMKEVMKIKI